jgi:DNA-binding MarR family transcriptional regulator
MLSANKKLAFELQNVMDQFRKIMAQKHSHSKLKDVEKRTLFLIYELKNGQPVTTSEIAKNTGVTLGAVTHQINAMKKQGLIMRLPDIKDRRIILIELTKKGFANIAKLRKEFAQKTQTLVDFLGEKDTNDLIRLVKKLSEFGEATKKKLC